MTCQPLAPALSLDQPEQRCSRLTDTASRSELGWAGLGWPERQGDHERATQLPSLEHTDCRKGVCRWW